MDRVNPIYMELRPSAKDIMAFFEKHRTRISSSRKIKTPETILVLHPKLKEGYKIVYDSPFDRWPFEGSAEIAFEYPELLGYGFLGRLAIDGRFISKSNSKARYLEPKYRTFEQRVALIAKSKLPQNRYAEGWVTIFPGSADKKHIDPTNGFKSLVDALVNAGIFLDDKHIGGAVFPFALKRKSYVEVWKR